MNEIYDNHKMIGIKHELIKKAINLSKGDNKSATGREFLLDGLWGHEKILKSNVKIEVFIYCNELIY